MKLINAKYEIGWNKIWNWLVENMKLVNKIRNCLVQNTKFVNTKKWNWLTKYEII